MESSILRRHIRNIIKESVTDDDYYPTFDFEDKEDLSGSAYDQFLKDYEKELQSGSEFTEPFKEPTDEELKDIEQALELANLDLPSEAPHLHTAEKSLEDILNEKPPFEKGPIGDYSLNEITLTANPPKSVRSVQVTPEKIIIPQNSYSNFLSKAEIKKAYDFLQRIVNGGNIRWYYEKDDNLVLYAAEALILLLKNKGIKKLPENAEINIYTALKDMFNPKNSKIIKYIILRKVNGLLANSDRFRNYVFDINNPWEYVEKSLYSTYESFFSKVLETYQAKNSNSHFINWLIFTLARKTYDNLGSFIVWMEKQNRLEKQTTPKEKQAPSEDGKDFLKNILKDPQKAERFNAANEEILSALKNYKKISKVFELLVSGYNVEDMVEDFPKFFKDKREVTDNIKYLKQTPNVRNTILKIYKKHGFGNKEIDIDNWGANKFKQSKEYEKNADDFGGLFEIRKIIREEIMKTLK